MVYMYKLNIVLLGATWLIGDELCLYLKRELTMWYPSDTAPRIMVTGTRFSSQPENCSLENAIERNWLP